MDQFKHQHFSNDQNAKIKRKRDDGTYQINESKCWKREILENPRYKFLIQQRKKGTQKL
jgi:hypothetical protein